MTERRVPCPACKAPILPGARKCRACRAWVVDRSPTPRERRFSRAGVIVATAVASVLAVLINGRPSPVGEAPPLTSLAPEGSAAGASPPAGIGPDDAESAPPSAATDPERRWRRVREFRVGDCHPLDVAFNPRGGSVYVSGDDASLREYKLKTGELIHRASVPAQGDRLRVLFERYVAVLRREDAARIPVMDTTAWDRDPILLDVGRSPGDILELPDGRSVVAATTDSKRVIRFELPSGARTANITLSHATGQLFVVNATGRAHVGALGALLHNGRPAGAWIDLFDPGETPFGATRRSIAVGREPRDGAVTADGAALFFPDRVSNSATLLRVSGVTESKRVAVGASPTAGFLLANDRYGVTLNEGARTASVIDLSTMTVTATLPLNGAPRAGVTSPDRKTLFVVLGGDDWPPQGSGVAVIAGDPPKVVASLPTGKGAVAAAVSKDGTQAVIASYADRSLTVLEQ